LKFGTRTRHDDGKVSGVNCTPTQGFDFEPRGRGTLWAHWCMFIPS